MSDIDFFLKEYFNLPLGEINPLLDIITAVGGTIYQDGTVGYSKTFADADAASLVTHNSLSLFGLLNTPIKWTIRYQINSIPDGDLQVIVQVGHSPTQPSTTVSLTLSAFMSIYRVAGNYQERWRAYNSAGTDYYYNGATSAWTTTVTDYVRLISLDTWYDATLEWNPFTRKYTFSNGVTTATFTSASRYSLTDPFWSLFCGENITTNYYGQMKMSKVLIENKTSRGSTPHKNRLLTDGYIGQGFEKGVVEAQNSLMTDTQSGVIALNEIRSYDEARSSCEVMNTIGELATEFRTSVQQMLLDGRDVSDLIDSWSFSWSEDDYCKTIDVAFKKYPGTRPYYKKTDAAFLLPRLEILVNSQSLGVFMLEEMGDDYTDKGGTYSMKGRSKTALLDRPFAEWISQKYGEEILLSQIVSDLAAAAGITSIYSMLDGMVGADKYAVEQWSPIQIIKDIAEAGGGLVLTDYLDRLLIVDKERSTNKKTGLVVITNNEIDSLSYLPVIPTGENRVLVERYESEDASSLFARIYLSSDKDGVTGDGKDTALLTAYVVDKYGEAPTVALITDEEVNSSSAHRLSVSKTIRRVECVYVSSGGVRGALVDGPYTFDGREIITTGVMASGEFLVTYEGGQTLSWSIEGEGAIINNVGLGYDPDLIIDGMVQREIAASSVTSAGFIKVTAEYDGQESNTISLSIDDPRVGSIELDAEPMSVARGGKYADLIARVEDPDGNPVADDTEVLFAILGGGGYLKPEEGVFFLTGPVLTTSEALIEDVDAQDLETVNTRYPIYSLESIKIKTVTGALEDTNYATGATYERSEITLLTPLPRFPAHLRIEYHAGGIARAHYQSPATDGVPHAAETVDIVAICGGKKDWVTITIGSVTLRFDVIVRKPSDWTNIYFPGAAGSHGSFTGTNAKQFEDTKKEIAARPGYSIELRKDEILNCAVSVTNTSTVALITCRVNGRNQITAETALSGDGSISGTRWIKDKNTNVPIVGAIVVITWSPTNTETLTTDAAGAFRFKKGEAGAHPFTATKDGYKDLTDTIELLMSLLQASGGYQTYEWVPVEYYFAGAYRYIP